MTDIYIEKLNEVHLRVYSDDFGLESELTDFFTFEYPGAKFTPQYKARLWDGKIRLYDSIRKTLYVGLISYVEAFADQHNHTINYINEVITKDDIQFSDVIGFIDSLDLRSKGQSISVRDYQLDSIHSSLCNKRGVLLSPTGSGKSLVIYILSRWHLLHNRKVLIITPTTSLVEQMYSDFDDYSSADNWRVRDHCQKLYSGFPKHFQSNILTTTWQSIYKLPKQWFDQFDVVIGDEAHQFKAKSLTVIMEKMTNVAYRLGTTGSLDDKKVHRLVLEGIFGKVYRVTTTKQLQDNGQLAGLQITSIVLKHTESTRVQCNKADYQTEIEFLVQNQKRNTFIRNLALRCKGNTLVLFQFVEKHGVVLYDMIQSRTEDRNIYLIHGNIDVDRREDIRRALTDETNAIVVASVGTTSTGINIPSIENIIFASPTKSIIRVLQSIGRGLRLNSGKTHCNLFDLTDDMQWKSWKNHTLKHGSERLKLYMAENFSVQMAEVSL